jgi:GTPase SAR1 family protein
MCDCSKKQKPVETNKNKILQKPTAAKKAVKLVLCGNAAVGKTSITMRYKEGVFKKVHEPTLAGAYQ